MVVLMTTLSVLMIAVTAVLMAPAVSDLVSLVRAVIRPVRSSVADHESGDGAQPFFLFLVPAHDEELLIEETLHGLLAVRYPIERRRIVVIADNCSDRTAEIARATGVECLERVDPEKPGKPFAMEWALEQLGLDGVDAVVIVDADTLVDPGYAEAMARRAPLGGITLQSFIGVSNPDDNSMTRMSAVLSSSRYHFAFPLKQRAGLNTPLQGPGSLIGAEIFRQNGWQTFSICEDWEMYALYTRMGITMGVDTDARVLTQEARSFEQSKSQRERWAAGKMTVLGRFFGPILRSREISLHQKFDALAELAAPGPAVHLGGALVLAAVALLLPLPAKLWILVGLGIGIARISIYTALAIIGDPHPVRAALSFLFLPFYTVWRLGVQVGSLRMLGDKPWVRTARHS